MNWSVIARKEVRDASRSRSLWALSALMVLAIPAAVYVVGFLLSQTQASEATGTTLVVLLTQDGSFFITSLVPVLGLMAAYACVVGERSSGSLKMLLGLPYSRRDVVVGKFVGRTAVLAAATVAAFAVGFLFLFTYDELALVDYLFFFFLTTVLGTVYVAVAVGISAGVRTRSRAAAAAVGVFFFFKFLWDTSAVPRGVVYAVTRDTSLIFDTPGWYEYVVALGPNIAYSNVASGYLEGFGEVETLSVVVLVAWIVVPVVFGYLRFETTDI